MEGIHATEGASLFEDALLVEFTYLVFTPMPGGVAEAVVGVFSLLNTITSPCWLIYFLTLSRPKPDSFPVTLSVTTRPIPELYGLDDAVKVPLSKMTASLFS